MRRSKTDQPLKSKIEVPWDTIGKLNTDSQVSIPIEQIILPPTQPRRYFDSLALKQLTESIQQHGILQPLLVRPREGGKHELVAGERRYRAALSIGLLEVPVVIRELDDNTASQLALVENLLREDLNPVEETEGIVHLLALKLSRSVEEIPPLLRRLQHSRKEADKSPNNVIGKTEMDSASDESNVIASGEDDKLDDSNNVIGKTEMDSASDESNIIVKEDSDKFDDSNNVIGKTESESALDSNHVVLEKEVSTSDDSNNVIGKTELDSGDTGNNVALKEGDDKQFISNEVNSELKIVESVFSSLGLMTWESFANNRLPLLNLPSDILEELRLGSLEYTKARAIATIQDKDERVAFLEQAIAQNWSLSEIKQHISEKKTPSSTQKTESKDYKERFTAATTKLRKSRIWSDPKKHKLLEKLLSQLETLTNEG